MLQLLFSKGIIALLLTSWTAFINNWIVEKRRGYIIYYTVTDQFNKKEYVMLIDKGIRSVRHFFGESNKSGFTVFVHPDRHSLDSSWQKDWNMSGFKSECWMVASGVYNRLDLISPKTWIKEACEHDYADRTKTQELITHELVHVYHGQLNKSPDFSDETGMDWFVEGLAAYASGQCDSSRIAMVKKALADRKIPNTLDKFWTGNLKYGIAGSIVMYIDYKYGRKKLIALLRFNKLTEVLSSLDISEFALIIDWEKYLAAKT